MAPEERWPSPRSHFFFGVTVSLQSHLDTLPPALFAWEPPHATWRIALLHHRANNPVVSHLTTSNHVGAETASYWSYYDAVDNGWIPADVSSLPSNVTNYCPGSGAYV